MKNIKKGLIIIFSVLLVGALFNTTAEYAEATTGGQVITEGKITFYESETEPSSSGETQQQSQNSSEATITKPTGKLPSTGEVIKNYGFIGVGLILLILLIVLYRKRKKAEEHL